MHHAIHDRPRRVFTAAELEAAIAADGGLKRHHEHPDCIRICLAYLDAQCLRPLIQKSWDGHNCCLKHRIEAWGGRYVSANDVALAVRLAGVGEGYCSLRTTRAYIHPDPARLADIPSAGTQYYSETHLFDYGGYSLAEVDGTLVRMTERLWQQRRRRDVWEWAA